MHIYARSGHGGISVHGALGVHGVHGVHGDHGHFGHIYALMLTLHYSWVLNEVLTDFRQFILQCASKAEYTCKLLYLDTYHTYHSCPHIHCIDLDNPQSEHSKVPWGFRSKADEADEVRSFTIRILQKQPRGRVGSFPYISQQHILGDNIHCLHTTGSPLNKTKWPADNDLGQVVDLQVHITHFY